MLYFAPQQCPSMRNRGLILVLLFAACSDPTSAPGDGVAVSVAPAVVAPDGTLAVTVENRTRSPVSPGFCPLPLQERRAADWVTVRHHPSSSGSVLCAEGGLVMTRDGVYTRSFRIREPLPPGEYRLEMRVDLGGRATIVHSPSFTVSD